MSTHEEVVSNQYEDETDPGIIDALDIVKDIIPGVIYAQLIHSLQDHADERYYEGFHNGRLAEHG